MLRAHQKKSATSRTPRCFPLSFFIRNKLRSGVPQKGRKSNSAQVSRPGKNNGSVAKFKYSYADKDKEGDKRKNWQPWGRGATCRTNTGRRRIAPTAREIHGRSEGKQAQKIVYLRHRRQGYAPASSSRTSGAPPAATAPATPPAHPPADAP
jgi:hypothetical protein